MKTEYNYREGSTADVEQFRQLGLLSYGQFQNVLAEEAWQKMAATCGDENTYVKLMGIARSFVCEHKDKIIGMAFFIPSGNPVAFFQEDWSYIRLVGVDPAHEGQGIGRKLTELCIESAKRSGEKILVLHTSEFQNAARHIYESMGFKKFKELDPIYSKKYWLYSLDLNREQENISYHKADRNDLQTLVDMRIEFAIELNGPQPPETIDKLRHELGIYFSEALGNKTCIFYLAKSKNITVGIGGIILRTTPGHFKNPSGKWGYLMNMYTIPTFRRKGICARILNLLVEDAHKTGVTAFELHATIEGEYVYKQNGFLVHHEPTYRKFI